ncbi:cupin domain-containing protein [Halobacteriales archaeon QS_4_70_19]|nr:MAG: cupin domain-containing protein [Halobacteriales archaeon QS_4_70_19]
MEKVTFEELDADNNPGGGEESARRVGEALGTEDVGLSYYELDAGQNLSGGVHTHMDQEEIFYVLDGTLTFRTLDGDVEVEGGEAVRFAPGDFQQGKNESDESARLLGIGAPKPSTDVRVPQPCAACGESDTLRFVPGDGGMELQCPECGETHEMPG